MTESATVFTNARPPKKGLTALGGARRVGGLGGSMANDVEVVDLGCDDSLSTAEKFLS